MPSLKDLRARINTVKSTRKITKAMQMVAAAKLKRAQEAAEAARPYAERMASVIANLSNAMADKPGAPELLVGNGKDDTHLVIVATADRGLCGGFNSSIVRKARELVSDLISRGKTVKILCVGVKGHDQLKRLYGEHIIDVISFREVKAISSAEAADIGVRATRGFENGDFDVVTLVYAQFQSVIKQVPTAQTLIPAIQSVDSDAELPDLQGAIYDYEPDEEAILRDLLPRNINTQIFSALLENVAGEMGAKMTAMDNATRNAGELIKKLSLQYNRARQANITKELIEIISGAEAL